MRVFFSNDLAAKAALRRKHAHEKTLEQTSAQVMQLEQQISSIEAANINHETLQAMKTAGEAMKTIHNGMKLEQVDETMYVIRVRGSREQKTPVIWEKMCLLMTALQGHTPRATNDQPGNWRRYYEHAAGRYSGRGRPGG